MKTPPLAHSVVRVVVGILLCAACFQAGRAYQELSASAADRKDASAGSEAVVSAVADPASPVPAPGASATAAPGDPVGESGDLITPLNVRDPSALVMPPLHHSCPPPEINVPEPRLAEPQVEMPKPKELKEGRLLELLKKEDKRTVVPKHY